LDGKRVKKLGSLHKLRFPIEKRGVGGGGGGGGGGKKNNRNVLRVAAAMVVVMRKARKNCSGVGGLVLFVVWYMLSAEKIVSSHCFYLIFNS